MQIGQDGTSERPATDPHTQLLAGLEQLLLLTHARMGLRRSKPAALSVCAHIIGG